MLGHLIQGTAIENKESVTLTALNGEWSQIYQIICDVVDKVSMIYKHGL